MLAGKRDGDSAVMKHIDTLIGKETVVKGKIEAQGNIRIDGDFEGDINTTSDIVIGESGRVLGTVNAKNITVAGELQGTVEATGKLELVPTARLIGDVRIAVFVVEDGAIFKGQCEMIVPADSQQGKKGKHNEAKNTKNFDEMFGEGIEPR